ncbi:MAG: ABC transporter permease subunit [Nitrospira sp.]
MPQRSVVWYSLRTALPPIITLSGVWYTVLIAGAVLTETIFSWGGVGQYAVQAVQNADWFALQGVVLMAALLSLLVYLAIDLLHALVDPRVRIR